MLGASVAFLILNRSGLNARLARRRDLGLLLLIGAGLAPLLSAGANVLSQLALGTVEPARALPMLWQLWGAEAMAVLAITPLLLSRRVPSSKAVTLRGAAGPGLLAVAILLSGAWAVFDPPQTLLGGSPWLIAPTLLLMWMSLRVASFALSAGTALALLMLASVATVSGLGPFAHPGMPVDVALLWSYSAGLAFIPLLSHTLLGEMRQDRARWQGALDASGIGVAEWDLSTGSQIISPQWAQL
ncbi:MAG: hypothetical protein C0423_16675, partial [Methylibium sp.]|nr:hypothetical protein [Methylibium sp.]